MSSNISTVIFKIFEQRRAVMSSDWTAEVVGRMHTAGITGLMLAQESGYSNSYVSTVLNGKKGNTLFC